MSGAMTKEQGVLELSAKLRSKLIGQGASLVGYADLSTLPQEVREGYHYGISIAVQVRPEVVRRLKEGPNMQYYYEYNRINTLLNELDEYTAAILCGMCIYVCPWTQKYINSTD